MATHAPSRLGTCPACGVAITEHDVLIEYERGGRRAVYADCPGCHTVVDPL